MAGCYNTTAVPGCFNGTPVIIHVVDDGLGKPATRILDVNGDIVAGATAANTVPGACPLPAVADKVVNHFAANIADGAFAGLYDPLGNGASWTYSGTNKLQSITVTALEAADMSTNYVELVHSGVTKSYLLKGQSITFSVAQHADGNEFLRPDMVVNCGGNAAAYIAWTEDQ